MCGIAGYWAARMPDGGLDPLARGMAAALAHRGPDGEGVWIDDARHLALAFRRLAIQDLSPAGDQPMVSADGRYVIVFNGEIYNFRELRAAFGADKAWRGGSDTEVLLELIARDGLDRALAATDGMFAFALWDRRDGRLTLARDRVGEKPLYYGRIGGGFAFASELKALMRVPGWRGDIDRNAVAALMRYAYIPAPHCIFTGIAKLPPGTYARLDAADGTPRLTAYWDASAQLRAAAADPFDSDDAAAADELESRLLTSVRRRLIADVPVGGYLSGGIDSATVAALMQAASDRPARTFTIAFDDPRFDESAHAAAVAKHLGTDHTEARASETDVLDLVADMPRVFDEPFADVSQLPTLLLAKVARQHVTTVLTGDGGDELFAGYPRYARIVASRPGGGDAPGPGFRRFCAVLNGAGRDLVRPPRLGDKLYRWREDAAAATCADIHEKFMARWRVAAGPTPAPPRHWFPDFADAAVEPLTATTFVDFTSYLPDDLLVKVDRTTMAVGLEGRMPILSPDVVDFAWRLPARFKQRGDTTKWLLRQVLYRHVPAALVDRPKQGFEPPLGDWLRGPLHDWAEPLLDPTTLEEGGLDPRPVLDAWAEHQRNARDWRFELWNVLMYQAWRAAYAVAPRVT